jgi:DNA-binding GntR family transcriptional regulator
MQLGAHVESAPTWRAAVDEHAAVVDAIAAHDAAAARAAMRVHLERSRDRYAVSWAGADDATGSAARAESPATTTD